MDYNIAKFSHILALFMWIGSTSSIGLYFLYTLIKPSSYPQDEIRSFYRWMVNLEVLSLIVAISMGLWMLHLMKFRFDINWLNIKLLLVLFIILPLEALNFWFVNFYIPKAQEKERAYRMYDLFVLLISLPLIFVIIAIVYLAVFKP
ncbi:MAG: hypothetical protein NZL90_01170 [Aquificaceae bacterium]|nr:hypothetical protein [Aquificaceae bacterium]MDW8237097.1 hypothetical protein [Aquificaceae bacterium]